MPPPAKRLETSQERKELIDKFYKDLEKLDGKGIACLFFAVLGYTVESVVPDGGADIYLSLCVSEDLEDVSAADRMEILKGFRDAIDAFILQQKGELQ